MVLNLATRRFTRAEYQRMAELFAPGERVELIEGQIVEMSPHDPLHSNCIEQLTLLLARLYGTTHRLRVGLPLGLGQLSEPEPDLALISHAAGEQNLRERLHPGMADLIIEVANTSLSYDRGAKASLYARFQLPEYWIVNIPQRCVEVYSTPAEDADAPFGWRYADTRRLTEGSLTPAFSSVAVSVSDLLAF